MNAIPLIPNRHDVAVADAVHLAAEQWTRAAGAPEADLEQTLTRALSRRYPHVDAPTHTAFDVPDWNPCPRGIDILIRRADRAPQIPIELKVEATDQILWDAYKLAALQQLPTVEAAYLICAAKTTTWERGRNCVELFPTSLGHTAHFASLALFDNNRSAWRALLRGGSARPTKITAALEVTSIAAAPSGRVPGYEIRAARITPGRHSIPFINDWPAGLAATAL